MPDTQTPDSQEQGARSREQGEINKGTPDTRLEVARLKMNPTRSSGDEQHIAFKSGDLNERDTFKSET